MPELTPTQQRAVRRIGHKGADHIAPGNTTASFDAALAHGCDMVEFDVLPERGEDGEYTGRLVLAHDFKDAARRTPLTLEEGLDHLSSEAFAGVELDVDLKTHGYEERVIAALRERGMEERTLISTMETVSLPVLRAASDKVRIGWSVPKVKRNYLANPATKPLALATVAILRRTVPRAIVAAHARRRGRRRHVALLARHPALRPRRRARRRRALRLDRRRRRADPPLRAHGRHRRHHQRPAPVRPAAT